MTIKSLVLNAMLTIALSISITTLAAEDTSMHAVYSAAEAGKFGEAQAIMDKVLQDHPNSAKAHYVEAELLAKQGKMNQAQTELATAEKLQPGLPFAKPAAVEKLKSLLGASHSSSFGGPTSNSGSPWGMILLIAGLIALLYFAVKMMTKRNPLLASMSPYGNNAPINPQPPYGSAPMMNPTASGGLGSGIMGGLATGAALGAGMVAGEALMHHFTDGGNSNNGLINDAHAANNGAQDTNYLAQDDMGGNDFGIADSSSWDDSSSGSDDWT